MANMVKQDNRFIYVNADNEVLAEITFVHLDHNRIDVNHTFVSPTLRGQGIGKQLVDAVVSYARDTKVKIVPTCSYVKNLFERMTDYHDVYSQ